MATYINSGNAIVRSTLNRQNVIATIAEICRNEFSFEKAIFAPTLDEWEEVIARNPFAAASKGAPTTVHAALLENVPEPANLNRVRACAVAGEAIKVIQRVARLR